MFGQVLFLIAPLVLMSGCADESIEDTNTTVETGVGSSTSSTTGTTTSGTTATTTTTATGTTTSTTGTTTSTTGTTTTGTTTTTTEPGIDPTCGELPEATPSMALAATIDTHMQEYLVCTGLPELAACPDYSDLPSTFVEDVIGNPWGDPWCWYSAEAVCGPEAAVTKQCCYAFVFDGIICA